MSDAVARASRDQARAADPAVSVWLSANAGSGKTRVLTDRVARLLLQGADPSRIRCLTYTRAAAAEMAERLEAMLGRWALMEDEALAAALRGLTRDAGAEAPAVDAAALAQARRLFAKALETPGGLRIGTIHAFCEGALRRFPLEAGVSPDFAMLDDPARDALAARARERLAQVAEAGGDDAFDAAADSLTDEGLDGLIRAVLSRRSLFAGRPTPARLAAAFGVRPDGLDAEPLAGFLDGVDRSRLDAAARALAGGSSNDAKLAVPLARAAAAPDAAGLLDGLRAVLRTSAGPRKLSRVPTAASHAAHPWIRPMLEALSEGFEAAAERAAAIGGARRAIALNRFAGAFLDAYAAEKHAAGALDYDDLIEATARLLADPADGAWALWKLDGGLDHLLVDEAQDTSPAQWDAIRALTAEFGDPTGRRRTLFVVGDEKQSIYSFQGAAPRLFADNARVFAEALQGGAAPVQRYDLVVSFRSSPAILRVVDSVFAADPAGLNAAGEAPAHAPAFPEVPGRVDLWPLVGKEEAAPEPPWDKPLDAPPPGDPRLRLAGMLAGEIARWVREERLPGGGAPVRPGDVLVLVRKRDRLAQGIVRGLKRLGVPVAGSDRIAVARELAVRDLLALARVALTPEDDLTLAALLRSPLCGLSEEALLRVAHGRDGTLWAALQARAGAEGPAVADAVALIERARRRADFLRPYEFLDRALAEDGGRASLIGRLGAEAEDGVDELLSRALAYETARTPSLEGFLDWLARSGAEIKREMDKGDPKGAGAVRVMTIHGAKGLEAPVVVVPDMATRVRGPEGAVLAMADAQGPFAVWSMPKAEAPAAIRAAQEDARRRDVEEGRRLLYVAMTRAKRWLVLCGAGEPPREDADPDRTPTWHALAQAGMEAAKAVRADGPAGEMLRVEDLGADPAATAAPGDAATTAGDIPASHDDTPPTPLPPPPAAVRRLAASALKGEAQVADGIGAGGTGAGGTGAGAERARDRGTAIHAVLERAPDWPAEARAARAGALLARLAPWAGAEERAAMAAEALGAMEAAGAEAFFAPGALAEAALSLSGALLGLGRGDRVTGRVDRMAVGPEAVRAVDFKTDAAPPADIGDVPEGYLRQMAAYREGLRALYPGRRIELSLLWTATRRLMALPDAALDAALERMAAEGGLLDRGAARS